MKLEHPIRSLVTSALAFLLSDPAPAWSPGTYPVAGSGFTVNSQSRNDVVGFWHGVYQASEGYWNRHAWTGNHTAAAPYDSGVGSNAAVFVTDVERRINFHRALCGLPAAVRLNTGSKVFTASGDAFTPVLTTTKIAAAQRSAYMLIRTWGYSDASGVHPPLGNAWAALNHDPVQAECVAWTTAAWNAHHYGNLAMGFYGPGAIDAYLAEFVGTYTSGWNTHVGHRRWVLYPPATDMATGDTPGAYDPSTYQQRLPTNVLYVVPNAAERVSAAARFTAFPPSGFVPAKLNSGYWSLSYPGADFSSATVALTTAAGAPLATTVLARNGAFGEPALVWQVPAAAALQFVSSDTTFRVTVAGIAGTGVPASHSYQVTLINPDQITSDQCVFGAASPKTTGATYRITPPQHAESLAVNAFQSVATAWAETAEDSPAPAVVASTTGTYAFRSPCSFTSDPSFTRIAGLKTFRLTFPVLWDPRLNTTPEQSFELDREIIPGSGAKLTFRFQRGYMTPGTNLAVEASTDQGLTWNRLGDAITGRTDNSRDAAATDATRDLTVSTEPARIRFRYYLTPGLGAYTDDLLPTYPTGVFIDTIATTNCQWLQLKKENPLAATATSFTLDSVTAGLAPAGGTAMRLRMRTKLGNRWMPYGPLKPITFSTGNPAAVPVFSPSGGELLPGTGITISAEAGALIRYRINGGAELTGTTPVTGIAMPAYPATLDIAAGAEVAGKSSSAIATAAFTTSALNSWIAAEFPGIQDPLVTGAGADPDHDGVPNILEFALGGDPDDATDRGDCHPFVSGAGAGRSFFLTIATRAGAPEFAGTPFPSATVEGITYTILGGTTPQTADGTVIPVAPVSDGLPSLPAGWQYRTFKLASPEGQTSRGFIRVKISGPP